MAGPFMDSNRDVPFEALYRPETGDVDAWKLASYLHVPPERLLAEAIRGQRSQVSKDPASPAFQPFLQCVRRILEILEQAFPMREQVLSWLNHPHPDLGGRTPVGVILLGHPDAVRDMLEAALIGTPS